MLKLLCWCARFETCFANLSFWVNLQRMISSTRWRFTLSLIISARSMRMFDWSFCLKSSAKSFSSMKVNRANTLYLISSWNILDMQLIVECSWINYIMKVNVWYKENEMITEKEAQHLIFKAEKLRVMIHLLISWSKSSQERTT